jgi:hypothetical protein
MIKSLFLKLLSFIFGFDKNLLKVDKDDFSTVLSFTLFYLFLMSISIYAFYHAMYLVTENLFISIVISMFFTFLVHNMYRLIIATSFKANSLKSKRQLYAYISVKGFLIIVLSIFISKSICTDVFESDIKRELHTYKSQMISNFKENLNLKFLHELTDLKKSYQDIKEFNKLMDKSNSTEDDVLFKIKLKKIDQKKQSEMDLVYVEIRNSNFFMKKIRIVSSQPKHWFFSLICVITFLIPLYIYNTSTFFLEYQKSILSNNKKLILYEYDSYKTKYVNLLSSKTEQDVVINERYENPPFNTKLKTRNIKVLKKGSLLEWLKNHNG